MCTVVDLLKSAWFNLWNVELVKASKESSSLTWVRFFDVTSRMDDILNPKEELLLQGIDELIYDVGNNIIRIEYFFKFVTGIVCLFKSYYSKL